MNSIKGGRPFYGEAIGILMLDMKAPLIPGNVGNATTYDFPVRFKVLEGVPSNWWCDEEGPSPRRLEIFIRTARELEREGVRAITTGCGFFAIYQKEASRALNVPLFNSPLLLVPMVSRMIGEKRKVGILTAGARHLKGPFLRNAGIDESIPTAIAGMDEKEEFTKVHVTQEKSTVDVERMEAEVVDVARRLVSENPDMGALVFECSDLPPFAAAVHEAVGLPVFDFITLVNTVYMAVVKKRYHGFL
ncbi:MAG: aspartate/glutamate racemase family protein [Deltaproteobacteria bacterium]|nr:aspartate/glutamate racemase family protein [Deltaproteobacteria bacterium]MBW2122897.1 aspartate/glutamate racemase family protein [Deltaproteobacteria bacterium]